VASLHHNRNWPEEWVNHWYLWWYPGRAGEPFEDWCGEFLAFHDAVADTYVVCQLCHLPERFGLEQRPMLVLERSRETCAENALVNLRRLRLPPVHPHAGEDWQPYEVAIMEAACRHARGPRGVDWEYVATLVRTRDAAACRRRHENGGRLNVF
jgi:hypothetical protein